MALGHCQRRRKCSVWQGDADCGQEAGLDAQGIDVQCLQIAAEMIFDCSITSLGMRCRRLCVGQQGPVHSVPSVRVERWCAHTAERACKASLTEGGGFILFVTFVVQSLEEEGGFTTLVVSRLLDTCDAEDVPILLGTTRASPPDRAGRTH